METHLVLLSTSTDDLPVYCGTERACREWARDNLKTASDAAAMCKRVQDGLDRDNSEFLFANLMCLKPGSLEPVETLMDEFLGVGAQS